MKNNIHHAVDKVASQLKQEETKILSDPLSANRNYAQKDMDKTSQKSDEVKVSENKKIPEKYREIEKEMEL